MAVAASAVAAFRGQEADSVVVDLPAACLEDGGLEDFQLGLKGVDQLDAHQVLVVEVEAKRGQLIG